MLVDAVYISPKKKLLVSYVDKTGNIKFKNYNWKSCCLTYEIYGQSFHQDLLGIGDCFDKVTNFNEISH